MSAKSNLQIVGDYFGFYTKARTIYNLHPPTLYAFAENVLEDKRMFYAFDGIEVLRSKLKADQRTIRVHDFGAGSRNGNNTERKISDIVSSAVSGKEKCRMLFRMVLHFKPKTIIELGTSLGMATLYLSMADGRTKLFTLEGCPNISAVAANNFKVFKRKNIVLKTGPFEKTLQPTLKEAGQVDFVYIDGHHSKAATLNYFQQCLPFCHNDTVIVFDDIYWSKGMTEAWQEIIQNEAVTLSVDLFQFGLVFFKKEIKTKAHERLVSKSMKPWVMGFFK